MNANLFIGPVGIPDGFILISEQAVRHPADGAMGALIQNEKTGRLCLLNAGVIRNYPSGLGGARKGAGRKPLDAPKKTVSVRLTDAEMDTVKVMAKKAGMTPSMFLRESVLKAISV